MSNKVISKTVIYSKDGIDIIENLHKDNSKTYTGRNNNKNALRTYIQAADLETVKEYIL